MKLICQSHHHGLNGLLPGQGVQPRHGEAHVASPRGSTHPGGHEAGAGDATGWLDSCVLPERSSWGCATSFLSSDNNFQARSQLIALHIHRCLCTVPIHTVWSGEELPRRNKSGLMGRGIHPAPLPASQISPKGYFLALSCVTLVKSPKCFSLPARRFILICFYNMHSVSHTPYVLCNHPSFSVGSPITPTLSSLQQSLY